MMKIHRLLMNKCSCYGHVLQRSKRVPRRSAICSSHNLTALIQVRHGFQSPRQIVPQDEANPLSRLITKLALLRLKLLWDWEFSESHFMENSRQAAAVFTDFVRRRRNRNVERCSTPMGFKQIKHDLLDDPPDWRLALMRFEKVHFRRAIPLKVQLLRHYDHRFAFLDVVFVALRRSNDFRSPAELREMAELLEQYVDPSQLRVSAPTDLRRDLYALPARLFRGAHENGQRADQQPMHGPVADLHLQGGPLRHPQRPPIVRHSPVRGVDATGYAQDGPQR
ncbi:hypothetical protein M5D96_011292 [Drosophila gunungcola]|uniref:Uncharacterized protein n=1 Tax=Drosophila gunungcola TaxID=103775 RepID=A0A9P9YF53_9MUSC|nr:hypothetical protein M5D96_011292 [Drosophila gunungcola]